MEVEFGNLDLEVKNYFGELNQQQRDETRRIDIQQSGFSERYPHKERPKESGDMKPEVIFVSEEEGGRQYCAKVCIQSFYICTLIVAYFLFRYSGKQIN